MSQIERDAVAPARVFLLVLFVLGLVTLTSGLQAASQAPAKETLPGIVNFTRIDSNVAVGGAVSVEALPELKRRGFKAVISHARCKFRRHSWCRDIIRIGCAEG